MPTAALDQLNINYRIEGDGPETVVLINGLADDLETWTDQVPALLEAGYRVLRFDNRGIGLSDKPVGPYTTAMFAADTKALVDHLRIGDFHLLGVSMGGMIAQEYALAYPSDLRGVTLACTYAAPGPFCSRMFSLWADTVNVMGVPTVMRDVTLWAFTPEFFETRPDDAAEFETAMRFIDQPIPAYLAQLHSIRTHDAAARLGSLNVPTLVLAGETDILIPVELSRQLHSLIPGARWATTKGGHACLWEHPDEFNQALIAFIGSLSTDDVDVAQRHRVAMLMLHYGTPRDREAREQLAAVLPEAEVTEPDDVGAFEITLAADDEEQALERIWDAVAASGTDDHIVFLEHPQLPEHWRPRSGQPGS
jgi:3-oxoadipate enol-lactonase